MVVGVEKKRRREKEKFSFSTPLEFP